MLYIFLISSILLSIISIIITKKRINPIVLFNSIWIAICIIYQLRLTYLQSSLSNKTYLILELCLVSFSVGFYLTKMMKETILKKIFSKKKDNNIKSLNNISIIRYVFLFWLILSIIEIIVSGGIPVLWKIIGSSKTYFDFGIPSLHGFLNSIGLVLSMIYYNLYLNNKKTIIGKYALYHLLFMLVYYLCLITRQVIITAIIELIVVKIYNINIKKINYKTILKYAILFLMIIIVFGLIGNFRTGYDEFISVSMFKYRIPKSLIGFLWVYMYLTMSLANINELVNISFTSIGLYPVASTFIPTVFANLLYSNTQIVIPNFLVTQAFNVSGYFVEFYLSYKEVGTIIISVLYGIVASVFFYKIDRKANEKNILYYAVVVQIILLSFFYNHLLYLPSSFQLVVIYFIYNVLFNRSNNEKSKNIRSIT